MGIVLIFIFEFVSNLCKAMIFYVGIPGWGAKIWSASPPLCLLSACRVAVSTREGLADGVQAVNPDLENAWCHVGSYTGNLCRSVPAKSVQWS